MINFLTAGPTDSANLFILYYDGYKACDYRCLRKEKIVSLLSMARLVQVLPSQRFFQIHRSYIINVDYLNFIQNQVVSIGKGQLPVSKARKSEFMKWVESKGLF